MAIQHLLAVALQVQLILPLLAQALLSLHWQALVMPPLAFATLAALELHLCLLRSSSLLLPLSLTPLAAPSDLDHRAGTPRQPRHAGHQATA